MTTIMSSCIDEKSSREDEEKQCIQLPNGPAIAFRNLKDAKQFAMDIGGSLTKIAYYSTIPVKKLVYDSEVTPTSNINEDGSAYEVSVAARLHFVKFETSQIEKYLDYVRQTLVHEDRSTKEDVAKQIYVTGGGAYKYWDLIRQKLGVGIVKMEEMECICTGCNFLLGNLSDEAFSYDRSVTPPYKFHNISTNSELYPYLLVTIGSGVSVIKVESKVKFERIGGTATGGGTFWGLGRLLTGAKGFDELLEMATHGDFRHVDMLVKDIYGDRENQDYSSLGLSPTLIASSFGKAIHHDNSTMNKADMARSLLYMVSNDVGQISALYAMLHNIRRVYFGGFFLRHHPFGLHTISYAVNFWSKGDVETYFLRHEGYLGAIGAFLRGQCHEAGDFYHVENYSWTENLYGSSGFHQENKSCGDVSANAEGSKDGSVMSNNTNLPSDSSLLEVTDHLEIDRYETRLGFCPLLKEPDKYKADTVDLTRDDEARIYWLDCFEESLPKFTQRAVESELEGGVESPQMLHPREATMRERARKFQDSFLARLKNFREKPYSHGNLTVRSILDTREHCLSEFDFHDPYFAQKRLENDAAIALFPKVSGHLLSLSCWKERQLELTVGLLAGNVFDWGAKEVALVMESRGLLFDDAINLVRQRPWLVDDFDAWIGRLQSAPPHRCAAIFTDNSGVDIILGVLPFVEELLRRGTNVLLCANDRPVLNDVTYAELLLIVQRMSKLSDVIREATKTGRFECFNSGQSSACLDMSRLNRTLVEKMSGVDLLILQGMGRAVHTNLYAEFKCDCLKVAVLKNKWLAAKLGGKMFDVVFKYERGGRM